MKASTEPQRELQAATRFHWERVVRRVHLPSPVKLIAFLLAQYGGPTGRDIRPGTPRLAATSGMGERTVDRHLATLRAHGLIQRISNGGGPHRAAAVYRLTIPSDLLQAMTMLHPDEVTPATQVAADPPVDNPRTPATQEAGVPDPPDAELPPSAAELPPNPALTPATQVADHHTTTQPSPPSRSPESPRHLRNPQPPDDQDPSIPELDPEAERHRQHAALAAAYPARPDPDPPPERLAS